MSSTEDIGKARYQGIRTGTLTLPERTTNSLRSIISSAIN
jgi:hypothetical protein